MDLESLCACALRAVDAVSEREKGGGGVGERELDRQRGERARVRVRGGGSRESDGGQCWAPGRIVTL